MKEIAVFASGGGTTLQALYDAVQDGRISGAISFVLTDRPCRAAERADGFEQCRLTRLNRKKDDFHQKMAEAVPDETGLIVLAGFLSILKPPFVQKWRGKIINTHPSLLPDFGGKGMYGSRVHRAVLDARASESGCTVHYVDESIDGGAIIAQRRVPVLREDSVGTLSERVQRAEKEVLVKAVADLCRNG